MEINSKASRRQKAREFHYHAKDILIGDDDFYSGTPFVFSRAPVTAGLRVCSVKFDCGMHNGRLLKKLTPAILPQLVPWECETPPTAYIEGRYVVIEAAWPKGYARDDIRLDEIAMGSHKFLIAGVNSYGTNIGLPAHEFHHLLVAGATGSGKSWLLRSLVRQILYKPKDESLPNEVVLLDGKGGEGLGIVSGISPYQRGPLATKDDGIINALGWTLGEMHKREQHIQANHGKRLNGEFPHVYVVFDEPQRLTKDKANPIVVEQINQLATQGRAFHIHMIVGTQKPLVASWGDSTTPDQFEASVGGWVKTFQASKAVTGSSFPDLRTLQGKGDMYVVAAVPNLRIERVQATYIPEDQLTRLRGCQPMMAEWPEFDTSDYNGKKGGRPAKIDTPKELGIGIEAVLRDKGREWLRGQFNSDDTPGTGRADKLLDRCAEVVSVLTRRGTKCLVGREHNQEQV